MENKISKSKAEFESFITENLNYPTISKMAFEEYKDFIYLVFTKLNRWRENGLNREDIDSFVNKHYSNVMDFCDIDDVMFERRFSGVTEELVEFCSDPMFWGTEFDLYMKKWERMFKGDWYKYV